MRVEVHRDDGQLLSRRRRRASSKRAPNALRRRVLTPIPAVAGAVTSSTPHATPSWTGKRRSSANTCDGSPASTWSVNVIAVRASGEGSRTRLRCGVDDDGRLGLRASEVARPRSRSTSAGSRDRSFAPAFAHPWPGVSEVELRAIGDGDAHRRRSSTARNEARTTTFAHSRARRSTPRRTLALRSRGTSIRSDHFLFGSPTATHPDCSSTRCSNFADVRRATTSSISSAASDCSRCRSPSSSGPGGRVRPSSLRRYAVRDARENAEGLRHLKVREWTVTPRSVNDTVREGSLVVLDPPRHGLAKGVVEALVRRRLAASSTCRVTPRRSRATLRILRRRLCPE